MAGKFSANFEREEHDFYRTWDPRAVEALSPHVLGIKSYAEPCFGMGDLVLGLDKIGLECVWGSDLILRDVLEGITVPVHALDAFNLTPEHVKDADAIITNPPWDRSILHPMIRHFASLKPTYLLFEADWAHTKQAIPFLNELCTDIISIGRMKWDMNKPISGTKDMAWYLFTNTKEGDTIRFHPRKLKEK